MDALVDSFDEKLGEYAGHVSGFCGAAYPPSRYFICDKVKNKIKVKVDIIFIF